MTPPLQSSSRDGLALLLALVVVAIVSGLSAWLFAQSLAARRSAADAAALARLRIAAAQAVRSAMDVLRRDDPSVDSLADLWARPVSASLDGVSVRTETRDAGSLFLWNAFASTNASPRPVADVFSDWMAACGHLDSDLPAAALADFMDPDSDGPREASFYARLPAPFAPPNRPLWAPADLLLVHGLSPALLAPEPRRALFGDAPIPSSAVLPLPRGESCPVNLNTASPALLLGVFGLSRDADVRALLALRQAAPLTSVAALAAIDPAAHAALAPLLSVSSSVFRIRSVAALGSRSCSVSAWVRRAPDGAVSVIQWFREEGAPA